MSADTSAGPTLEEPLLDYATFLEAMSARIGRPPPDGRGGDAEPGLDSLERLELVVALEDLVGAPVPDELLVQLVDLREAHEWYRVRITQGATRHRPRPAAETGVVPLSTRRVRLRTLSPPDYEWLHELTTDESVLVRWRDRGRTFRIEEWLDRLWAGVAAQFVVTDAADRRLGLVTVYQHDPHNRHARLAALFGREPAAAGWQLEGTVLAAHYAFEVFDLVKLYADVVDFNLPAFASGLDRWFVREGLLTDHEYAHGRHWPVHVLATSRERFASRWQRWWPVVGSVP